MATRKSNPQAEAAPPKRYFIVNPAGAIHEVTYSIARMRLRQIGYRLAMADEIAKYNTADGNQRADRPLCEPWSSDPDVDPVLE
jgi:hypothetical protein